MKITVIGAGQTGRGYLGRLAFLSRADIIFIDKNQKLLQELDTAKKYQISFYGNMRKPLEITGFQTVYISDPEAINAVANADLILTAVYADNLEALVPLILKGFERNPNRFPPILVCENGVFPSDILRAELPSEIQIGEALILCTTCADGLNIVSQDLDYLPYDASRISLQSELVGFIPEYHFYSLCIRKNYTYNCLSAVISYFGAEKGYSDYSSAANDDTIISKVLFVKEILDRVISKEFSVSFEEQKAFSDRAVSKFCNAVIKDSIERNAKNAYRKLGRQERIIGPLLLADKYHEDIKMFEALAACAIRYGIQEKTIKSGKLAIINLLCNHSQLENAEIVKAIVNYVYAFDKRSIF